jgi:hypothetical protein
MPAPLVGAAAAIAARLATKKAAQEAAKRAAKRAAEKAAERAAKKAAEKKATGGVSVRSKSVDVGTKRMVTKQNKAADSYRIKDLDKYEKGKAAREAKKLRDAAEKAKQLKNSRRIGRIEGATATAGVGTAGLLIVDNSKKKKKKK